MAIGMNQVVYGVRYTGNVLRTRPENNSQQVSEHGSGILVTACTYGEGPNIAPQQTRQLQILVNNAWVTVGY